MQYSYKNLSEYIKPIQMNNAITESVRQFSANLKAVETVIKPMQVNNAMMEPSKQLAPTLQDLESVKTLQVSGAMGNFARQLSLASKAIGTSNPKDETT